MTTSTIQSPDSMRNAGPRVTLTFDNGPHPDVTPRVLDVLRDRGIRATFFVIGLRLAVPGSRALAERARAEGHWIGNHTWSHSRSLGQLSREEAVGEIEQAQSLIGDLAHADRLFRPMGNSGHLDERLFNPPALQALHEGGYTVVLWNALAREWLDPDGWVPRALDLCQDGSLLVVHDIATGAMDHLEQFLDQATDAGVRFRQEFPPNCVPIRRGETVGPLNGLITPAGGHARP